MLFLDALENYVNKTGIRVEFRKHLFIWYYCWGRILCRSISWIRLKGIKTSSNYCGSFFAGLIYHQYQQLVKINWSKLEIVSQNTVSMLMDAITLFSNQISNTTASNNNNHTFLHYRYQAWGFH